MDLNKVMLIGNLTRDPEGRTTPTGQMVTSFGLATNLVWTDTAGVKQKRAEFHNIVAWRRLAEICNQYLKKGNKVYIEGRLQTKEWQGQDGVKKQRTEVVADNMIMLEAKGGPYTPSPSASQPRENFQQPSAPAQNAVPPKEVDEGVDEIRVEDIPF